MMYACVLLSEYGSLEKKPCGHLAVPKRIELLRCSIRRARNPKLSYKLLLHIVGTQVDITWITNCDSLHMQVCVNSSLCLSWSKVQKNQNFVSRLSPCGFLLVGFLLVGFLVGYSVALTTGDSLGDSLGYRVGNGVRFLVGFTFNSLSPSRVLELRGGM